MENGNGKDFFSLTADEMELIAAYRKLPNEKKREIFGVTEILLNTQLERRKEQFRAGMKGGSC